MKTQTKHQAFFELIRSDPTIRETLQQLGFFIKDYVKETTVPNSLWYDWGYTDEDMRCDHSWVDCLHPEDKAEVLRNTSEIIEDATCAVYRGSYRFRKKNGDYAWVISSGKFISFTDKGEPEIYVGTDIDVTWMKETEEALLEAKKHAEKLALESETLLKIGAAIASSLDLKETCSLIFQHLKKLVNHDIGILSILKDNSLEIVSVSGDAQLETSENMLGEEIPIGDKKSFIGFILRYKESLLCNDIDKQFPDFEHPYPQKSFQSIIGLPLISKDKLIGVITIAAFQKQAFSIEQYESICKFSDNISVAVDNAIMHERMSSMALTDYLTGLNNRRGLGVHWKMVQEQAVRYKRDLSLLIVDIDLFKKINDSYGHDIGDTVIQSVAQTILDSTRATDLVARFGGEEFVVVLPETDADSACLLAEKLRKNVEQLRMNKIAGSVTVSIGVSFKASNKAVTFEQLTKEADQQLYIAKNSGRNKTASNGEIVAYSDCQRVVAP